MSEHAGLRAAGLGHTSSRTATQIFHVVQKKKKKSTVTCLEALTDPDPRGRCGPILKSSGTDSRTESVPGVRFGLGLGLGQPVGSTCGIIGHV